MNSKINKYLIKVIQYFVLAEGLFILYLVGSSVIKFFTPDPYFLIIYSLAGLTGIVAIIVSLGIMAKKRWAIILYWILIALYVFILFFLPRMHIYIFQFFNVYLLFILNIIAANFLFFSKNKANFYE